jgi:NAD+ kinase
MRIAIYGRTLQDDAKPFLRELFDEFHRRKISVLVHDGFSDPIQGIGVRQFDTFATHADLKQGTDYIFSLGGDGTLLDTVGLVRDSGIPVMGINFGRLGFLSSIGKEEIRNAITAIESGTYILDQRALLRLESNKPLFDNASFALNEFTLHRKDTSSMVIVNAYLNGEFLNSYWADGIIVSTATGSTGYSLSCGGPVVLPNAESFIITPVAPHNLNIRPLVVPDDSVISFEIEGRSETFLCTLDSRAEPIDSTYQLAVRKEAFKISLVRLGERNFLTTLRAKLHWGIDSRN